MSGISVFTFWPQKSTPISRREVGAKKGDLLAELESDEPRAALDEAQARVAEAEGYPGRSWRGRVEEVADSVTLRKLKPQDPGRPTDTRILALKVASSNRRRCGRGRRWS